MLELFKNSEKKDLKTVNLRNYNTIFSRKDGMFVRWGKTVDDDPKYSPIGPEILDIEISTICHGINGIPCSFCYKSNTSEGVNMSLVTFKKIIDRVNQYGNLQQVALGIGSVQANPDFIPIMRYCRNIGIVPNVTVNGAYLDLKFEDKTYLEHISELCGAVSVSNYDKKICFNAVKAFIDKGVKQCNIHQVLAAETISTCMDVLKSYKFDDRLKGLNAVIFLSLKKVETSQFKERNTYDYLTDNEKYEDLLKYSIENKINIGFDSCGCNRFKKYIQDKEDLKYLETLIEPCESGLFSSYINVYGEYYPCSFAENSYEYINKGISVLDDEDFLHHVWYNQETQDWRKKLHSCNRSCPVFNLPE